MDKEEFRRVTTEVLREYGFNKKIRNWYFMNMERVVVRVELCAARFEEGAFALMYILCFKDIHEYCAFRTLEDYRNMPMDMSAWKYLRTGEIMNVDGTIYKKWAYYPEEYTEERWRELLKAMIHKEFDPLQTDFENCVRENYAKEKEHGISISAYRAFIERGLIFKE